MHQQIQQIPNLISIPQIILHKSQKFNLSSNDSSIHNQSNQPTNPQKKTNLHTQNVAPQSSAWKNPQIPKSPCLTQVHRAVGDTQPGFNVPQQSKQTTEGATLALKREDISIDVPGFQQVPYIGKLESHPTRKTRKSL